MYCPGCGRSVHGNVRFCPYCGRPVGDDAVVIQPNPTAEKKGMSSSTIAAIITVAAVIVIAAILILSVGLSSFTGSSATMEVTVYSYTSLSSVSYSVYFDDSLVESGSVAPFSYDSFERTYRWSSSDPTTVVVSVESSGGLFGDLYSDHRTIEVSDGGHYSVILVV